jgi:flagellar motor switch protein FliM
MNPVLTLLSSSEKDAPKAIPELEESLREAARTLHRSLSSRASGDFRVKARSIRVKPLGTYMEDNKPSEPAVFATFNNGATAQPGLVLITGKLLSRMMGCMFGDGESSGMSYRAKHPITDLEFRVARRIILDLLAGLNSSWPEPTGARFRLGEVSSHGRFITPDLREDPCLGTSIEITAGEVEFGEILLTVPLPANLSPLSSRAGATGCQRSDPAALRERAMDVRVEVRAELARLTLTLGEVSGLRVGDILPLGPQAAGVVSVSDRVILRVEPGVSGGYRSVRITERVG